MIVLSRPSFALSAIPAKTTSIDHETGLQHYIFFPLLKTDVLIDYMRTVNGLELTTKRLTEGRHKFSLTYITCTKTEPRRDTLGASALSQIVKMRTQHLYKTPH